ncbi:MAG: mechanosensitive ion channel [Bacteroidota bacterium]|nr:mechanosensitive ion channel [Bacteroidota bacterium]
MKRIMLFYSFLILGLCLNAQTKTLPSASNVNKQPSTEQKVDSMGKTATTISSSNASSKSLPETHQKRRSLIQTADTLTLSDYIMSIERVNDNLNTVRDSAQLGFETEHFKKKINDITNDIQLIRQNIRGRHSAINIKNIYLYQSFASNLDDDNNRFRSRINMLYNRVYHAKLRLKTILQDPVFRALYADKNISTVLDKKLIRLERKWARTDSLVKVNIDTLNILKVNAADNSMNISNMLNIMDKKLDKAKPQLFRQEANYLWQFQKPDTLASDKAETLNIFDSEHKAIGYYISQTTEKRGFILFLGILLFVWLFFKRKLLRRIREEKDNFTFLNLHYLKFHPISSLLVLLLCLMPFFDAYAPTSYITIEYVLLFSIVSFIFFKRKGRNFLFYWFSLAILFVVDSLTYLIIEPSFIARFWMLAIHVVTFTFSYRFYKKLPKATSYYKLIRSAMLVGITLTGFAIIGNIFGRFSLSGLLGLSGIFAIVQALTLPVFIDSVIEIILLQLVSSRLKKGVDHPFDCSVVTKKVKMPLILISMVLWGIMLTSNLNIYHDISNSVIDTLTIPRTIGSISFKLISVLFFFVIIWFAHILQRLISFLFGETGSDIEDLATISKGQHSRILITRLLVLIGGYLLAIAASGLPIDKLTFVLGALGVGIGMGLQHVVNNFVSGIILIFDGSLQIGDEIEVSGQAGKVKEIGLRASTINTADGAEVIIPNGNILSQNIVNWTFSNDQKRVTITFNLSGKELDANVINEVINSTIKEIPNVISKRKPVILYTKVMPESLSLTVHFWSTIGNTDQVKSEIMLQLSATFASQNIGFNKPKYNCPVLESNCNL